MHVITQVDRVPDGVCERKYLCQMWETPRDGKHDPRHREGRQNRPDEGKSQDGANVPEEEPLLHAVPGVKDDWRQ